MCRYWKEIDHNDQCAEWCDALNSKCFCGGDFEGLHCDLILGHNKHIYDSIKDFERTARGDKK